MRNIKMAEGGFEMNTFEEGRPDENTDIANREDEQLIDNVIDDNIAGGYENPVYNYNERGEEPEVEKITSIEQELVKIKIDEFYKFIKTKYDIEPNFVKRENVWRDENKRLYYVRETENKKVN